MFLTTVLKVLTQELIGVGILTAVLYVYWNTLKNGEQ